MSIEAKLMAKLLERGALVIRGTPMLRINPLGAEVEITLYDHELLNDTGYTARGPDVVSTLDALLRVFEDVLRYRFLSTARMLGLPGFADGDPYSEYVLGNRADAPVLTEETGELGILREFVKDVSRWAQTPETHDTYPRRLRMVRQFLEQSKYAPRIRVVDE